MSDSNPYAPPQTEPEAPSSVTWYVDGIGLAARNGVILPRVDLETGEHEIPLRCGHRILLTNSSPLAARGIALGVAAVLLIRHADLPFVLVAGTCVWFLCNVLMGLRGPHSGRIVVWEFAAEGRFKRRARRRRLLIAGIMVLAGIVILMPFMLSPRNPDFTEIIIGNFVAAVLGIIGLAVWASRRSSFAKTLAGPPGWMRISPLHPQAMDFLQAMENEMLRQVQTEGVKEKRKVHTVYLHRYPLRLLLGKNIRNPLLALRLTLMKLLRSKFLEREFYHYSEAARISSDELCLPLRKAVASWLDHHPDWHWLYGESDTSPAGDIIVHIAVISSPDLAHTAAFSCVWNPVRPDNGIPHLHFNSYQMGGTLVRTYDHRFLHLPYSAIKTFRASGSHEEVFKAHIENCQGQAAVPPLDANDLLARIEAVKEETDQLLTEQGLQGELRLV